MENKVESTFEENKYEAPVILAQKIQDIDSEKYNAQCPPEGTGGWGCCLSCERTN